MITTRGHMWTSEKRMNNNTNSEARPWRVVEDPSEMFLNSAFRTTDLVAGGFDENTIFVHQQTGEKRIVDSTGCVKPIKRSQKRKRRTIHLPLPKQGNRNNNGNARAYAIH